MNERPKREELARSGIDPGMVRLSVGLEHVDDLREDLEQALGNLGATP